MAALLLMLIVLSLIALQHFYYIKHWDDGLLFDIRFSRYCAYEGENITVIERLANHALLPVPWVLIEYKLSGSIVYMDAGENAFTRGEDHQSLYAIGPRKAVTKRYTALLRRRGVYSIGHSVMNSNTLLLSKRLHKPFKANAGMIVYPKRISVEESDIPYRRITGELLARRFTNPDPFFFRGIREYQPSDTYRQINFHATAKTGHLMSNIYDMSASQEVILLLNLQPYSLFERVDVQEEAIRIAAFFCRHFIHAGIPVGLHYAIATEAGQEIVAVPAGVSGAHQERLQTALSYLEIHDDIPPMEDYIRGLSAERSSLRDRSYILISPCQGPEIVDAVHAVADSGAYIRWIAPYDPRDEGIDPALTDRILYEVREHAG